MIFLDLLPGCVADQTFAIQGTQNRHCLKEIFRFLRDFRVAKIFGRKYINFTRNPPFVKQLSMSTSFPLTLYSLSDGQIKNAKSQV